MVNKKGSPERRVHKVDVLDEDAGKKVTEQDDTSLPDSAEMSHQDRMALKDEQSSKADSENMLDVELPVVEEVDKVAADFSEHIDKIAGPAREMPDIEDLNEDGFHPYQRPTESFDAGDEITLTKEIVVEERIDKDPNAAVVEDTPRIEDVENLIGDVPLHEQADEDLKEQREVLQLDIEVMNALLEEAGFDIRERNELTMEEVDASLKDGTHKYYIMSALEEKWHLEKVADKKDVYAEEKVKIDTARDVLHDALKDFFADKDITFLQRWGMGSFGELSKNGDTAKIAELFTQKLGEFLNKKALIENEQFQRRNDTKEDFEAVIDQE
jgi:hypothetical protein